MLLRASTQAVVQVLGELAGLAVLNPLQQVTALVVAVLRAAVAAQHVAHQFAWRVRVRVRIRTGWCLGVQQVARWVKGKCFLLVVQAGFKQTTNRVITVAQIATVQVFDVL